MDLDLSSILDPMCERVLDAALKEYRLVRGVKGGVKEEIKKLRFTVGVVRGVLPDAEGKQVANPVVRDWLKSLKQLLLDAEDVLDEIATDEALRRRNEESDVEGTRSVAWRAAKRLKTSIFSFLSVGGMSSSCAIAHQIRDINKRFDDITRVKDELGLVPHELRENRGSTVVRPEWRETFPVLRRDSQIIGRGEEMSRMRNLLLEATSGERGVHVICVAGMGGIGKTTLMQHVFNDPEVTKHFQFTKWVYVSNDFDVRRIAIEIKGKEEVNRLPSLEAALGDLRKLIEGKRFLLVLDDVWEENPSKWEALYASLSYGAEGSKIVVTTRTEIVSNITRGTQIVLKFFSNDDLWSIFQKYAFTGHDPEKKMQLIYVGRQIVEKLKGSPLAAKTIGMLLNSNMDVGYWTKVNESDALLDQSKRDEGDDVMPVLKLSYDRLPGHLKQCFAYCSLFPEDYSFDKDELVRLWMAQQFIDNKQGSHLESVGEEYFDHLVHMSLFEKDARWSDKYVMPDLICNLAGSVSKDDCLLLMKDDHHKLVTSSSSETIRHISIINSDLGPERLLRDFRNYKKLRTLLFIHCSRALQLSGDHLDILFTNLQRLRVLCAHNCNITELPKSIGKLKYLRYLDLSHNDIIKEFPKSLCDLHNLQVLNLRSCRMKELPKSILNLKHLRYLDLSNNNNIKELLELIGNLKHLRYLDLSHNNIEELPKSLCDLHNLQVLILRSCRMKELPKSIGKLKQLRCLNFSDNNEMRHLPKSIGKLKNLQYLNLSGNNNIEELPKSICVLHNLQVLDLSHCEMIKGLPSNINALINLRHFLHDEICDIDFDRKLSRFPFGVRGLASSIFGLSKLTALNELTLDCKRQPTKVLAHMSMLRQLCIGSLEEVKSKEEAMASRLHEKVHLEELELSWSHHRGGNEVNPELEREVIEHLRPASDIRQLMIDSYGGIRSPSWMEEPEWTCRSSLLTLKIMDCLNWEKWVLPPHMMNDNNNNVVEDDRVRDGEGGRSLLMASTPTQQLSLFLPCLQRLTIKGCINLRQLPPLPLSLTELRISNVGLTDLPGWFTSRSSKSSQPSLTSLWILICPNLTSLKVGLLRDPLPNLMQLVVFRCQNLETLPDAAFGHLPALETLKISHCPKLSWATLPPAEDTLPPSPAEDVCTEGEAGHESNDALPRRSRECRIYLPPSLQNLTIYNDNLGTESLSTLLRGLTDLRSLDISRCPAVTSLPRVEALPPLTTLRTLCIRELKGIKSLGGFIQSNDSLDSLYIYDCPELLDFTASDSSPSSSTISPFPEGQENSTRNRRLTIMKTSPKQVKACLVQYRGLQELSIGRCPLLTGFMNDDESGIGAELVEALITLSTTLCTLKIEECENLRFLSYGQSSTVSSPKFLKELIIDDCPKLADLTASESSTTSQCLAGGDVASTGIKRLIVKRSSPKQIKTWLLQCPSLQELSFRNCPQLLGFGGDDGGDVGEELGTALLTLSTTLCSLKIDECGNLRSLPPKLRSLSSLESLWIHNCPQIQRLPVGGLPESVRTLHINGGHKELKKRCEKGVGSDWHLISHIPERRIE